MNGSTMSRDAFSSIVASLDHAMVVVTVAAGDERAGCLVGFHAQSSIEPERYAVWLSKANYTYRLALLASHLGVHALTERDRDLAVLFGTASGDDVDKFDRVDTLVGAEGVPVLAACDHRMVVRKCAVLDEGGDHVCMVTEPIDAVSAGTFRPLRLSDVADLVAGHAAGERPHPPTERAGPG
jgi:flavin reductase (DIM6/NTAB) family NADH-FMN oxidoreductase RutF